MPKQFSIMASVGNKAVIKMIKREDRDDELQKVTWYKNGHVLDVRGISKIWVVSIDDYFNLENNESTNKA